MRKKRRMNRTLRDVAEKANVSVSTASRALNGHAAIPAGTVERVRHVAETLQYQPRRVHGRLDLRRYMATAKIGLLTLGMERSLAAIPAVSGALAGAEEALSEAEANVQFAHVPDVQHPPANLLKQRLRGLIVTSALQGSLLETASLDLIDWLQRVPIVWMLGRPPAARGDSVATDDVEVGRRAAEYLIERGHRHLAIVNPRPGHLIFRRREDGFLATAQRHGLTTRLYSEAAASEAAFPLSAPTGVESVQTLVDQLVDAPQRPTAIFAVADSIAVLVYRALAVRGLRVGQDISVISGNNDAPLIAGLHPRLTTLDAHTPEIGRIAVRQLTAALLNPLPLAETESLVAPTLVAGESVVDLRT